MSTFSHLSICAGCVCEIANGESDLNDVERESLYGSLAAFRADGLTVVVGDDHLGFRRSRCELCGRLPGDRYDAVTIPDRDSGDYSWSITGDSSGWHRRTVNDHEQSFPDRLTVGELRAMLARCDDSDPVVIATPDWFVHVATVVAPNDDDGFVALTLFPGRDFDSREV
jgi:hypothetical protein